MQNVRTYPKGERYPMGNICKKVTSDAFLCSTDSSYSQTTTQYIVWDNCMINNLMWDTTNTYFRLRFGYGTQM